MTKRHRRKFTDEFKAETVNLIRASGRTVGSVARELGIGETAVRRWVQEAEASGSPCVKTSRETLQALQLVTRAGENMRHDDKGERWESVQSGSF